MHPFDLNMDGDSDDIVFEYEDQDFDHDDMANINDHYEIDRVLILSDESTFIEERAHISNGSMGYYSPEFENLAHCPYRDPEDSTLYDRYRCHESEVHAFCKSAYLFQDFDIDHIVLQDWSSPGLQHKTIGKGDD